MKTIREQLEEVQSAISAVMTGQKYDISGRSLTRADLDSLQKREAYLIDRANSIGLDTIPGETVTKGAYNVSFR